MIVKLNTVNKSGYRQARDFVELNESMLKWNIVSDREVLEKKEEKQYRNLLKALYSMENFSFFVSILVDIENEIFIIREYHFGIEIFFPGKTQSDKNKIIDITITEVRDACFHLNTAVISLMKDNYESRKDSPLWKWTKENWEIYIKEILQQKAVKVLRGSQKKQREATTLRNTSLRISEGLFPSKKE